MTAPFAQPGASPATTSAAGAPAAGQIIGGRFEVERLVFEDAIGLLLAAKDTKTSKPIALRLVKRSLVGSDEAIAVLRQECRTAAQLQHRNIVATFGVGNAGDGSQFVACEWIDGATLGQLIAQRRASGSQLSLRGAYNVIAHAATALAAAHPKTCHGALRPSIVWVSPAGRVKVGGFGVGKAVLVTGGTATLSASEQAYLAPEIKAGGPPTEASDIFGLGAILYEMLTGRSPAEGFTPPSQVHPDATVALDQVLFRCLASDPNARYGSPAQLRDALTPLVAHAPEVPAADDFEIDLDMGDDFAAPSARPPANAQPPASAQGRDTGARPRPPARPGPPARPRAPGLPPPPGSGPARSPAVGERISIHEEFRASHVAPMPAGGAIVGSSASVDLKGLLAKITENDAARWMVVKDNLDHGPFSGRELVELILKGEVLESHGLLNMDSGERKKVRGFPDFTEFLEQYRLQKSERDQKKALARSEKVEKVGNAAKLIIGAVVVGMVALAAFAVILTLQSADEQEVADADARADLYERGEIEIEGTAGILPPPPRSARAGGGRRGGGGGARGGGSLSYEEAMNRAVNLGDVDQGGGEQQLTSADVAGVMNRHINQLYSCVSAELRSGGSLSNVQIDLAIAGSGQVLGASARQGSATFKSCIASRARGVRFPTFSAPRMGARFSFSVD